MCMCSYQRRIQVAERLSGEASVPRSDHKTSGFAESRLLVAAAASSFLFCSSFISYPRSSRIEVKREKCYSSLAPYSFNNFAINGFGRSFATFRGVSPVAFFRSGSTPLLFRTSRIPRADSSYLSADTLLAI